MAAVDSTLELADILAGIIHYTRWPDSGANVRICVDEQERNALSAIVRKLDDVLSNGRHVSVVSRRVDAAGAASLLDCQGIYFGDGPPDRWQPLLMQLAHRPVLTVGPGEDFCSYGGVFCLERSESGVRIKANLDAIARSGLRVNPQLLRLTQREKVVR